MNSACRLLSAYLYAMSCVTWASLILPKVCSEGEKGKKSYEGSQSHCAGLDLTGQTGKTSRQAPITEALLLKEGEGDTVGCCRTDRWVSAFGRALWNIGVKEGRTANTTRLGNSPKFTRAGCATWSNRLSMGPLPVAAYCAKKPKMASLCTNSQVLSVRSGIWAPERFNGACSCSASAASCG